MMIFVDCDNDGLWDVLASQSAMLKGIQHMPQTVGFGLRTFGSFLVGPL